MCVLSIQAKQEMALFLADNLGVWHVWVLTQQQYPDPSLVEPA